MDTNNRPQEELSEPEKNRDPKKKLLALAPLAVQETERILKSPKSSLYAQIQAIDIILNRAYGKPESVLKVENVRPNMEESRKRVDALVEEIRRRHGMTN